MEKLRKLIVDTAESSGLDMSCLLSEPAMTSHLPWKLSWVTLENFVLENKLKAALLSSTAVNRENEKTHTNRNLPWSVGSDFSSRQNKFIAKSRVLAELESASGKEIKKAESILSSIVFGLTKEPGFVERAVLSNDTRKRFSVIEDSILRAGAAMRCLARSANLGSAKVLTAVTAVLLPSGCVEKNSSSCRDFCETLGINPKSKYVELGIENRKLYDSFLMRDGDILVGEEVTCRSSPAAVVTDIGRNGSVTVKLLPFNNEKKYRSFVSGKVRRLEPELDNYQRKTRFDTTPQHVKTTIEDFFRRHVPISPNKRDIAKRRHPQHPAMYETKQAMLRYQTMNELWQQFLEEHEEMGLLMQNPKLPNTAPMIFHNNAPWEMRKAKDSGCLCKDCESFHLLRRGVTGACAAIVKILDRVKLILQPSTELQSSINYLSKIKDVISTLSGYETIVKCLQPCLLSNKLENSDFICLNGKSCKACGFRQWWSNGLRKLLMGDDSTINQDLELSGDEWSLTGIDWWYFSSIAKPTIVSQSNEDDNENDTDDYQPTQNTSRTLCQATKRGTLVDFLDEFETQSERHASHRNIVSAEHRAQIQYHRNVRCFVVRRDIDYSENGSIKDKRQIQSQYWVTQGYTLFVSISSWLMACEWNKTTGSIPVDAEVTVYGELAGEEINKDSFWAIVTDDDEAEEGGYEVTDAQGKIHQIPRSLLRHRKRHSVATGHVTDDKIHDRHAM